MVKIQGAGSAYDRLEQMVRELVAAHSLELDVTGWTRKTYDVYSRDGRHGRTKLMVRLESFATHSGEVRVFDDAGLPLAEAIAARLEQDFDVREATVIRE